MFFSYLKSLKTSCSSISLAVLTTEKSCFMGLLHRLFSGYFASPIRVWVLRVMAHRWRPRSGSGKHKCQFATCWMDDMNEKPTDSTKVSLQHLLEGHLVGCYYCCFPSTWGHIGKARRERRNEKRKLRGGGLGRFQCFWRWRSVVRDTERHALCTERR